MAPKKVLSVEAQAKALAQGYVSNEVKEASDFASSEPFLENSPHQNPYTKSGVSIHQKRCRRTPKLV